MMAEYSYKINAVIQDFPYEGVGFSEKLFQQSFQSDANVTTFLRCKMKTYRVDHVLNSSTSSFTSAQMQALFYVSCRLCFTSAEGHVLHQMQVMFYFSYILGFTSAVGHFVLQMQIMFSSAPDQVQHNLRCRSCFTPAAGSCFTSAKCQVLQLS